MLQITDLYMVGWLVGILIKRNPLPAPNLCLTTDGKGVELLFKLEHK